MKKIHVMNSKRIHLIKGKRIHMRHKKNGSGIRDNFMFPKPMHDVVGFGSILREPTENDGVRIIKGVGLKKSHEIKNLSHEMHKMKLNFDKKPIKHKKSGGSLNKYNDNISFIV